MTHPLWLIHMSHRFIMTCYKVPHNQPPPPNHLTPPPKDLVPYTEKRKFDDGIMEDFPPEKKQRLQNFPLANGIGKSAILPRFRKTETFRFENIFENFLNSSIRFSYGDFVRRFSNYLSDTRAKSSYGISLPKWNLVCQKWKKSSFWF